MDIFLERDILEDIVELKRLDTTLNGFHRYTKVRLEDNLYQNLSSMATALRPLYYQSPQQIGTRLGIDPYDLFLFKPEETRYFNTRSPYTRAYYVQGSNRDQLIDFAFAQNINPRWNIGFDYRRQNSNRIFGGDNTEILADHIGFTAFTSYVSKNQRYTLLYNYAHLNQPVEESGGVLPNSELENDGLFEFLEADSQLGLTARSLQTQNNHHIYHQFEL
ncbi:MAG: putative porin, partial [Bacteroidota bacterium]